MKKLMLVVGLAIGVLAMNIGVTPVFADDPPATGGGGAASLVKQGVNNVSGGDSLTVEGIITTIIRVVLYLTGIISVGFIIFGGVKYATSAGDSAKAKTARDTILYAVIGLVITIVAFAIVNFVVEQFNGGSSPPAADSNSPAVTDPAASPTPTDSAASPTPTDD